MFVLIVIGRAELLVIDSDTLASKTGSGGEGDVWLAVLGKVYDVTEGRRFYGEGGSYSIFAAKDASGYFASGKFDDEIASKVDYDSLSEAALGDLKHWVEFYRNKEAYPQIGVVQGIFYDSNGNETKLSKRVFRAMMEGRNPNGFTKAWRSMRRLARLVKAHLLR